MAQLGIAIGSIQTGDLTDDAVDTAKLKKTPAGQEAVTTAAIRDLAVTAAKLAAGAVGTTQIADGAVTGGTGAGAKIAGTTITAANIANGAVGNAQIADGAVTGGTGAGAKIAATTITSANIANGAVGNAQIADGAVTGGTGAGAKIAATTITAANIANGAVGNAQIADGAVTGGSGAGAKIAAATVATANLAAGAVGTAQIANGAVTPAKLGGLSFKMGYKSALFVNNLLDGAFHPASAFPPQTDDKVTVNVPAGVTVAVVVMSVSSNDNSSAHEFRLFLDGVDQGEEFGMFNISSADISFSKTVIVTGLTAASHDFEIRYRRGTGVAMPGQSISRRQISVMLIGG